MNQNILLFLVSLVILAALLYFSEPEKIYSILTKINPTYFTITLIALSINMIFRSARWQYLLNKVDINISLFQSLKILIPSAFISNLSPAKTAEPFRSVLLKKSNGTDISSSLPSIFVEKILDVIITSLISITGIIFFISGTVQFSMWLLLIIFFYLVVLSAVIFLLASETRIKLFITKIISLFLFIKDIEKIGNEIINFSLLIRKSFVRYADIKGLLIASAYTLLIWISEGILLQLFFITLGLNISPLIAFIAVPIATLVGVISFLPGGFGSSEAAMVIFISPIANLAPVEVIATVLLKRIITLGLQGTVGAFFISKIIFPHKL